MTQQRPAFGRKQVDREIPRSPIEPDADGVHRVLPLSAWEGEHGVLLRKLGIDPNEAANLMPTQQSVQAQYDAWAAQRDRFVAKVNTQVPAGSEVAAFPMLPPSLWVGELGPFLLGVCKVFPNEPWNTMLLPQTDRGAFVLDLPRIPDAYPPGLEQGARAFLSKMAQDLDAVRDDIAQRAQLGNDCSVYDAWPRAVYDAKTQIVGLANVLAEKTFGEEAYARHLRMWGKTLGWAHA